MSETWRQCESPYDGLVHDCIKVWDDRSEAHTLRCCPGVPFYRPTYIDQPVTCVVCLASRPSDAVCVVYRTPGRMRFNMYDFDDRPEKDEDKEPSK